MAFFVAFYSYKGGVGRTLALANVAWSLAEKGKRVVLLDLDLEAPGVGELGEFALRGKAPKPGFLEYAAAYRRTGKCPKIRRYVHPCREAPGYGKLWLMPAGRNDAGYQERLGNLSWRRLHPRHGTEPFVATLRQSLVEEFRPHYVLVDARTGLSDIGGLSTHLLADMVVLIFNLTRPCLEGSVRAYRSFETAFRQPGTHLGAVQLVASPVPAETPGEGSLVDRRLRQAVALMPLGTAQGRSLLSIVYDPAMVLAEELAVRHADRFPAAERYRQLREAIQRANGAEVASRVEEARRLRSEGQLQAGVTELRDFCSSHPDDGDGHLELGNFLLEAGQAREAATAFRRACHLSPDHPLAHRRLGEALLAAGDGKGAVEALEEAARLGAHSREFWRAKAEAYALAGKAGESAEARREALMAVLGDPRSYRPEILPSPEVKGDFLAVLSSRPPYPDFDPEYFWNQVMGSLSLRLAEKARILQRVSEGTVTPYQARELLRILEEEKQRFSDMLGPHSPAFQEQIAASAVDPFDHKAVLGLRTGKATDSALLLFVGGQSGPPAECLRYLEEAVAVDPGNLRVVTFLGPLAGLTISPKEERKRILEKATRLCGTICEQIGNGAPESEVGDAYWTWGSLVQALAEMEEGEAKISLLHIAATKYRQAIELNHDRHEALNNWGNTLFELADFVGQPERQKLLVDACDKYQRATEIKAESHPALYNWGNALSQLADLAEKADRRQLLDQACMQYQRAIEIKPDKYTALSSWGDALTKIAHLYPGQQRKEILEQAYEKYQAASEKLPADYAAIYNSGAILEELADLSERESRKDLIEQACKKYQQASEIKPSETGPVFRWAIALRELAMLIDGKKRREVLEKACEKYQHVVEMNADHHRAYEGWGGALIDLGWLAENETRKQTWEQAAVKIRRANEIEPGSGNYNLACVLALLGEIGEAEDLLRGELERRPEMCAHALSDRDLGPLWEARPELRREVASRVEESEKG